MRLSHLYRTFLAGAFSLFPVNDIFFFPFGASNGFLGFLIKLISHIYYLLSSFLSAFGATNGFLGFLIKLISHIYYLLSSFLSAFGAMNGILDSSY